MSDKKLNMIPDDFDLLLLNTMLSDYDTNKQFKKAIDMNAAYVNSIPVSVQTEEYFKLKTETLFSKKTVSNKLIIRLIILSVLFISVFFTIKYFTNTHNSGGNTPHFLPAIFAEKDSARIKPEAEKPIELNQNYFYNHKPVISSVPEDSTVIRDTTIFIDSKSGSAAYPQYNYYDRFDFDYAETIHPDGDNDFKLYPGDYSLDAWVCKSYKYLAINTSLSNRENYDKNDDYKKDSLMFPVYTGVPFKKGFEHLTWLSFVSPGGFNSEKIQTQSARFFAAKALRFYYPEKEFDYNFTEFLKEPDSYKLFKPYYISNTEVTNLEYREFMYWVKTYNGFKDLKREDCKSDKEYAEAFVYTFHQPNDEVMKHFGKNQINVYPELGCWSKDFPKGYLVPMDSLYLHHPAYASYPVVGVSYWQALAYCDWLTWIWQERIDKNKIPYELEFTLPNVLEWENAAESVLQTMALESFFENIICNLAVEGKNDNLLRMSIGIKSPGAIYPENFITYPANSATATLPENKTPILNLDANVSEWLKEDYSTWDKVRKEALGRFKNDTSAAIQMFLLNDEYFDKTCNDKNGKLVMGANWYDERTSDRSHRVTEAIAVKAFVDPDEQHATIGFRYVMHVKRTDEKEQLKKLKILGRTMPEIDYSLMKVKYTQNYAPDPEGFSFIPPGSFEYNDTTTTVQGFWAQNTEVCNLTWMIFLNYLIDNGRNEDLQKCIPNDPNWAMKMNFETDTLSVKNKVDKSVYYKFLPFPKKFVSENKIQEIPVTYFAFYPVVGISHEAAKIFANWLSEMTRSDEGYSKIFRLPTEVEWEYMAQAGLKNAPYAWGGPYTRNYKGCFIAKYRTSLSEDSKPIGDTTKPKRIDATQFEEIIKNQNQEFTPEFFDSNWPNPNSPNLICTFDPNNWGLYDVCGNVAEMIANPIKTKGGSWASPAYFMEIKNEEKWEGKPSDCVGFRLVQTYIGGPIFEEEE